MPTRTLTLFDPTLGLVSGSGDNQLTLTDVDDKLFSIPDQIGNNQAALLDGVPVTINAIASALGPQVVVAIVDGVELSLNLTPVRIIIEDGVFDDSYIYFPNLPNGATIAVGLSLPLLFPNPTSVPLCLAANTGIATSNGARCIGEISPGALVKTHDAGFQRVRWVSKKQIDFHITPNMRKHSPIVIEAGALGNGLPRRRLVVSPQHAVQIAGWRSELLIGEREVLVPAKSLINGRSIYQDIGCRNVIYCHLLLEQHHLIKAEGAWVETLFLGDLAVGTLGKGAREELFSVFPKLRSKNPGTTKRVRPYLKSFEVSAMSLAA